MESVICGDGPMGRAVAEELGGCGWPVRLLGRPPGGRHPAAAFDGATTVIEFSTAASVQPNVEDALAAGVRHLVIGTTGWADHHAGVERRLVEAGAAAIVAPTFSAGALVLGRLVSEAARALEALGGYDPWVVEWHRSGKRDRPSGTALQLADGILRTGARQRVAAQADGPADPDALEILSLRAGSSPGMHLVGFDAPGETLELRLTARDRHCYAFGARLAAEWLVATSPAPGIHTFASVIDDLITERSTP